MSEPPVEPAETEHDPTGLELAEEITRRITGQAPPARGSRPVRRRRFGEFDEQRSGAHPDDRDPQPIGAVLKQLSQRRGWRTHLSLTVVLRRWPALVGEANAEHSNPVHFAQGVLTIQCDSTAWASAMKYTASQLVAKLNQELGEASVKRIEIKGPHQPSWTKGRRTVRGGRGPRDTYG